RARRGSGPSSEPSRGHPEAPVPEILIELLAPPFGPAPLLGQLLEPLALLAAAPVIEHLDPLGAGQLLGEEAIQVGLRARHDEQVAELGHFLLGLLAPGPHAELVERLLRLRPVSPGACAVALPFLERGQAQEAGRDEGPQPELAGRAQRLFVPRA